MPAIGTRYYGGSRGLARKAGFSTIQKAANYAAPVIAYAVKKLMNQSGKGTKRKGVYVPRSPFYYSRGHKRRKVTKPGMYRITKKGSRLMYRLRNVERKASQGTGTLIYRKADAFNVLVSGQNQVETFSHSTNGSQGDVLSATRIKAVLDQLQYYDPSTPATLVTADGESGTYGRKFFFKNNYSKVTVRNNYQVPCEVTVYLCKVKADTSITPATAFTNGTADVYAAGSSTSYTAYLSDSPQFNGLWSIKGRKKFFLDAGRQKTMSFNLGSFVWDTSTMDQHTTEYATVFNGSVILFQVRGILGHQPTADAQGYLTGEVDVVIKSTHTVEYDAGTNLKRIYIDNAGLSSMTTPVVSNKPVADNQQISQA